MKIVVGSKNPVKINAVQKAFSHYFENVSVTGEKVNSEVSKQPMSAEESYRGAYNRAKKCLTFAQADFGVGIEGGLEEFSFGATTAGFVVILDKNGERGFGTSARMMVPKKYVQEMKKGEKELGDLIDETAQESNTKQRGGMFGLFTKGVVSREEAYFQGVVFALSQIVNQKYYK